MDNGYGIYLIQIYRNEYFNYVCSFDSWLFDL